MGDRREWGRPPEGSEIMELYIKKKKKNITLYIYHINFEEYFFFYFIKIGAF